MTRVSAEKKQGGIWFLLALAVILAAGTGLYWYIENVDSGISEESTLILEKTSTGDEATDLKGDSDSITEDDKELNQILTDLSTLENDADPKNFDALP